ncbi:MAG: ATPase, T2SS/T4P/T4SS family [Nanoarchaeota archaeon]
MKLFKKKEAKEEPHEHLAAMGGLLKKAGASKDEKPQAQAEPGQDTPKKPKFSFKRFQFPKKAETRPEEQAGAKKTEETKPNAILKKFSLRKKDTEHAPKTRFSLPLLKRRKLELQEAAGSKEAEKAKPKEARPIKIPRKEDYDVIQQLDSYEFSSQEIPITVRIFRTSTEYVPVYEVSIASISRTTEIILEKIRTEIIRQVSLGMIDITAVKKSENIEEKFEDAISTLVNRYFPDIDEKTKGFLITYLVQRSLGMGKVEILMDDQNLEEVAINSSDEPVWVYHRKHGWLKTNIPIRDEEQTKQYATMIARKVGRQVTVLSPLLDAHLKEGDRVNATMMPISTRGNTMTMRKFSRDPWTISKFIKTNTISSGGAALMWLGIQYELSMLICGGTASGKTSMLNVAANFFPPNQRIISIEDTREIQLPSFLHWIPMSTRQPNPEGKGEVSMLDLLVNSLRQRPDRIVVGEVRRQREAEVLFEAIHTGHSVYATFHANNAHEAITRLTNPPIDVPKVMLPAISMMVVQFRNRRTGLRRTFQMAEITETGGERTILQFDPNKDTLVKTNQSKELMDTLRLYTGYTNQEIAKILAEKEDVLKYLVKQNIESVDDVGHAMAQYYVNYDKFMKLVKGNKPMR